MNMKSQLDEIFDVLDTNERNFSEFAQYVNGIVNPRRDQETLIKNVRDAEQLIKNI